jgi:hypothetical protein
MMTMMFVIVKQMEKAIEVINVMVNLVMMMMESDLESQCHQKYVAKMEMPEQIDIVQV